MKLILLSDLHLLWDKPKARLDDARATQLNKLEYVLEWADAYKCVVLQAGDFFDSARSFRVLDQTIRLLNKYRQVKIYTIYGQHDTYLYNEESRSYTSLGILAAAGLVEILGSTCWHIGDKGKGVAVWGTSYGANIPKVEGWQLNVKVLVIHKEISNGPIWAGERDYTEAAKFLELYKEYDLILCGDAHQKFLHKKGKRVICNTGPLLRREASIEMMEHKPGFWVYETENCSTKWVEIPHKPADEVLSREHIEDKQEANEMLQAFIQAIKTGGQKGLSLQDNLLRLMQDNDIEPEVRILLSEVTNGEIAAS